MRETLEIFQHSRQKIEMVWTIAELFSRAGAGTVEGAACWCTSTHRVMAEFAALPENSAFQCSFECVVADKLRLIWRWQRHPQATQQTHRWNNTDTMATWFCFVCTIGRSTPPPPMFIASSTQPGQTCCCFSHQQAWPLCLLCCCISPVHLWMVLLLLLLLLHLPLPALNWSHLTWHFSLNLGTLCQDMQKHSRMNM